jgi:hypothetical protein
MGVSGRATLPKKKDYEVDTKIEYCVFSRIRSGLLTESDQQSWQSGHLIRSEATLAL